MVAEIYDIETIKYDLQLFLEDEELYNKIKEQLDITGRQLETFRKIIHIETYNDEYENIFRGTHSYEIGFLASTEPNMFQYLKNVVFKLNNILGIIEQVSKAKRVDLLIKLETSNIYGNTIGISTFNDYIFYFLYSENINYDGNYFFDYGNYYVSVDVHTEDQDITIEPLIITNPRIKPIINEAVNLFYAIAPPESEYVKTRFDSLSSLLDYLMIGEPEYIKPELSEEYKIYVEENFETIFEEEIDEEQFYDFIEKIDDIVKTIPYNIEIGRGGISISIDEKYTDKTKLMEIINNIAKR